MVAEFLLARPNGSSYGAIVPLELERDTAEG